MSVEFHELEVSAVIVETPECSSFELRVPPHLAQAYRYRAGQHLTFKLPWDDFQITRCYSLASCPETGETMKIGVKRVDGGRVSNWLNDNVKVGDSLLASVPEGRFVLDPETRTSTPLCLFAGGSGITPIISLLKSALVTTRRFVTLLYANQARESVIYAEELERLAQRHPDRFDLHHHVDADGGYLTAHDIVALLPRTDIAEYYICGPEPFMELVERTLGDAGVHEELIYIERFVSPADPDRAAPTVVDLESTGCARDFQSLARRSLAHGAIRRRQDASRVRSSGRTEPSALLRVRLLRVLYLRRQDGQSPHESARSALRTRRRERRGPLVPKRTGERRPSRAGRRFDLVPGGVCSEVLVQQGLV